MEAAVQSVAALKDFFSYHPFPDYSYDEVSLLNLACFYRKKEVVEYLLRKGANPNYHPGQETPLQTCQRIDFVEGIRILRSYGAH